MNNDKAVQGIADLIIAEANNVKGGDLVGSIYHVQHLVSLELIKRMDEIRRAERSGVERGMIKPFYQDKQ